MPALALRTADLSVYEQVESRIRQIRTLAAEDYSENLRKELLVVVDDFQEVIPKELRAAASAKSGEFLRTMRDINTGYGDRDRLGKLTFEMLQIAESILDAVKAKEQAPIDTPFGALQVVAPQANKSPTPFDPDSTATVGTTNVIVLPPPSRPAESGAEKPPAAFFVQPGYTGQDDPVVVRARNISKRFVSSRFELQDLSFELKLGQITAVVGRNGSGKSTLLKIVLGELASDSGTLEYPLLKDGIRAYRAAKANIGFVAQRPPRWRGKVWETLEFIASAYGIRGSANTERVTWLLNRFGLVGYENHRWAELSGGYQLRFELARAIVHRPYLLILDEPLANLDIVSQQEFLYDLRLMANSLRATSILITSQHLFEMEAIANQLFLLHEGRGAFLGDTKLLAERRKSNNYEIAIDADEETVRAALRSLNITSLRHYTTYYQVEAPLGVERGQILAALSKLPMAVSYFRDISNSSRPLMIGSTWLS